MIKQRTSIAPGRGRDAGLRELIAGEVRRQQVEGWRVTLGQRILGGTGAALVLTAFADDVAQLDAMRRALEADPIFQGYLAGVSQLTSRPADTVVAESILTAAPGFGYEATITETTIVAPMVGEERRAAGILNELTRSAQAAGISCELWRQIYGPDGPALLAVSHYADLAELDRLRRDRYPIVQQALAALGDLTRAPPTLCLTETVVPLPDSSPGCLPAVVGDSMRGG